MVRAVGVLWGWYGLDEVVVRAVMKIMVILKVYLVLAR